MELLLAALVIAVSLLLAARQKPDVKPQPVRVVARTRRRWTPDPERAARFPSTEAGGLLSCQASLTLLAASTHP